MPIVDCFRSEQRMGGTRHIKKAFTTLWFWHIETSQLLNCKLKTKQQWMPRGCVIHMLQIQCSLWCIIISLANIGLLVVLYISAWGFALLVSTYKVMRRPRCVERATVQGFTLFYVCTGYFSISMEAGWYTQHNRHEHNNPKPLSRNWCVCKLQNKRKGCKHQ